MTSTHWQVSIPTFVSKIYVRPKLPYVIAGGITGHFWALNAHGVIQEKSFSHALEITHIEAFQNGKILLLGVDNRLFLYNLDTDERYQLLALDSKVSCIFFDEPCKILYVGLWSNMPDRATLLVYEFDGEAPPKLLWSKATGDIVRSIYVVGDLENRNIFVGSENSSLLRLNTKGQVLGAFQALNRITKLRVYSLRTAPILVTPNHNRKQRMHQQIAELKEQWNLLNEKLAKLKHDRILRTDTEEIFHLDHRIADLTVESQQVEQQLNNLEDQLSSVTWDGVNDSPGQDNNKSSYNDQIRILILSDASDLQILRLQDDNLVVEASLSLDARPKNAFFYSQNAEIYMVGITTSSLYVFKLMQDKFDLIWQGDKSHTLIKSLYWWPNERRNRFVIERKDSSIVCYEFYDDRLVSMLTCILQEEMQLNDYSLIDEYITTKERIYSPVYSPDTHHLYLVTADGQLIRALVDLRYHIGGNFRIDSDQILYSNPKDRLRTVVIAQLPNEELVFFGGELGIIYRYSVNNGIVSMSPSLGEWIYEAVLIRSKSQQFLLVLSEHGLHLYDMELCEQSSIEIKSDILRCIYWDDQSGKVYVGSETGYVYEIGVLSPTLTTIRGVSNKVMNVFTAERKIRCIRLVHTKEAHLIIIGSEDGLLYAIDTTTGRGLWSYPFGQWVRGFEPIKSNNRTIAIALIGRKKELDLVSIEDGKLINQYELPYEPRSISIFEHLGRVGIVVTGLESNLYLYTIQFKNGQIIFRRSSQQIAKFVNKVRAIFTQRNIRVVAQ